MGHPDSGRIQAFIDGEAERHEAAESEAHLAICQECRGEEELLRASSQTVADALGFLDISPSVQAAKDRFQKKQRPGRRPFRKFSTPLPRAASIALLLIGGAASALPGSPVRRWAVRGWETVRPTLSTAPGTVVEGPEGQHAGSATGNIPETGAGLPVLDQLVEISLQGLPPEADLQVLWIEGTEAWVYAGEGTRFTLLDARLEVAEPQGAVRVELPKGPGHILLRLDGQVLLRKSGEGVEIVGRVKERTPDQIVFDTSRR